MQKKVPEYILLDGAEGTIQQVEAQENDTVDKLTEDVFQGRFLIATDKPVPCKCIDGRKCDNPTHGPNAAGGTETIFVAQDLTKDVRSGPLESVADSIRRTVRDLAVSGHPVGGHGDKNHKDLDDSGCGANDRLPKIYDMIVRNSDMIKKYVESILGKNFVDDVTEELIIANAKLRAEANIFSTGKEVYDVLNEAQESEVEVLEGAHKEVVAGINMREGTTLDRQALANEYGDDYQAFNIDAWSFKNAAEAISANEEDVRRKIIAMTYYNVATALVLCGPKMRVVVVD